MTSQDVIHSLFLPALRIKQDVLPGRYTYLWFTADKTGTYHLLCAEYCGTGHSRMTGRIVVMKPAGLCALGRSAAADRRGLAREGEALFRSLGCSGCHATAIRGPRARPARRVRPPGASVRRRHGDRRRGLSARLDPAAGARRRRRLHSRSCRASRARSSEGQLSRLHRLSEIALRTTTEAQQ